jgi:hypothetical protein
LGVGKVDEAAVVDTGVVALRARATGDRPEMFNLAIEGKWRPEGYEE